MVRGPTDDLPVVRLHGARQRCRPRGDTALRADRARLGFVLGLVLIVLGALFLVQRLLPAIDFSLWWPLLAIAAGIVLLVVALAPPRRPG